MVTVENPLEALQCDKALSLQQFKRRWPDLDPASLPGIHVIAHRIPEITKGPSLFVQFVVTQEAVTLPAFSLRHLAGVAEMRYALKVRPSSWKGDASRVHLDSTPDALWLSPEGPCAIEYDLRYNRPTVLRKQRDYKQIYVRQFWGVAVPSRMLYLQRTLQPDPSTRILLAPWYRD